jgi:S1-C subfamily serine protease
MVLPWGFVSHVPGTSPNPRFAVLPVRHFPVVLPIRVVPLPAPEAQSRSNAANTQATGRNMAPNSMLKQFSDERAALVQNAVSTAVAITIGRRRVISGIRWRGDTIVTAAEAVGGAERVFVQLEGAQTQARVIATDLTTDVAVLRVERSAATDSTAAVGSATAGSAAAPDSTAAVGSVTAGSAAPDAAAFAAPNQSGLLRVGETIVVVGRNPRGPAAVWGSVRLVGPAWSSRRGGKIDQRLELDVSFDPSFEGAAVIDMSGNVVAMAVPGPYQRILGIPSATIDTVITKVERFGHLPQPYLGIRLQPLYLDEDTRNELGRRSRSIAAVGGIDAGSPAAQADVQLGDLLLTLDGEPAESVNGMARRIANTTPGQTVALEVLRGGKPLTLQVAIGERPRC